MEGGYTAALPVSNILAIKVEDATTFFKRQDLSVALNEFYQVVMPANMGAHVEETLDRWEFYPSELVDRLVKKYFPTSAYRWMKRAHESLNDEPSSADDDGDGLAELRRRGGKNSVEVAAIETLGLPPEKAQHFQRFSSLWNEDVETQE